MLHSCVECQFRYCVLVHYIGMQYEYYCFRLGQGNSNLEIGYRLNALAY